MNENPWEVESIMAFYFLKCPECEFDTQKETDFEEHAKENHPLSNSFFGKKRTRYEFDLFVPDVSLEEEGELAVCDVHVCSLRLLSHHL